MKIKIIITTFLFILFSACSILIAEGEMSTKSESSPVLKIHIIAQKYKFIPDTITIPHGTQIEFELKSLDVTHGFNLKGYNINVNIPKNKKVIVTFVAYKKGTFLFRCSHFCGLGHFGMKGKLIVE